MALHKLMINGLPGNVAKMLAGHATKDQRFDLVPYSLTGAEIQTGVYEDNDPAITLIKPDERDEMIDEIIKETGGFIAIDFTHPSAVGDNVKFYCRHNIPFVMGTTGGEHGSMAREVEASSISAVIAPNMAKQIVGFQAMMAYAAENFPGLFSGYSLEIRESHQKSKADTSGTAKAMVSYFNELGIDFDQSDIDMVRDPGVQKEQLGVPEKYIGGHGWHTYTLVSPDETVKFEFTHNINGRDVYAQGTFDAVLFLSRMISQGNTGQVFNMIDVLKGASS